MGALFWVLEQGYPGPLEAVHGDGIAREMPLGPEHLAETALTSFER